MNERVALELTMAGARRVQQQFRGVGNVGVRQLARVQRAARALQQRLTAMGRRLASLGSNRLGGFGGLVAPISAAIGAVIALNRHLGRGDDLDKMSRRLGIAVEDLSEIDFALQQSGASIRDFQTAVRTSARFLNEALNGVKEYADTFAELGLDVEELRGKNPVQLFEAYADALAGVEDPTRRLALAQELFGRSGGQLIPLIEEGVGGLSKLREEARETGNVLSGPAARDAALLNDTINRLRNTFAGLFTTVATQVVPIIQTVVEHIQSAVDWFRNADERVKIVILGIGGMVAALVILGPALAAIIPIAVAAWSALGGPITLIIAALVAAGVAIYAFRDDIRDALISAAQYVLGWADEVFNAFAWLFEQIVGAYNSTLGKLLGEIDIDFEGMKESFAARIDQMVERLEGWKSEGTEVVREFVADSKENFGALLGGVRDFADEGEEAVQDGMSKAGTYILELRDKAAQAFADDPFSQLNAQLGVVSRSAALAQAQVIAVGAAVQIGELLAVGGIDAMGMIEGIRTQAIAQIRSLQQNIGGVQGFVDDILAQSGILDEGGGTVSAGTRTSPTTTSSSSGGGTLGTGQSREDLLLIERRRLERTNLSDEEIETALGLFEDLLVEQEGGGVEVARGAALARLQTEDGRTAYRAYVERVSGANRDAAANAAAIERATERTEDQIVNTADRLRDEATSIYSDYLTVRPTKYDAIFDAKLEQVDQAIAQYRDQPIVRSSPSEVAGPVGEEFIEAQLTGLRAIVANARASVEDTDTPDPYEAEVLAEVGGGVILGLSPGASVPEGAEIIGGTAETGYVVRISAPEAAAVAAPPTRAEALEGLAGRFGGFDQGGLVRLAGAGGQGTDRLIDPINALLLQSGITDLNSAEAAGARRMINSQIFNGQPIMIELSIDGEPIRAQARDAVANP